MSEVSIRSKLGSISLRMRLNAASPRRYGSATSISLASAIGALPRWAAATLTSRATKDGDPAGAVTVRPSHCASKALKSRSAKSRDRVLGCWAATRSRCSLVAVRITSASSMKAEVSCRARKVSTGPTIASAALRANGSRSESTRAAVPALETVIPKCSRRPLNTTWAKAERQTFPSHTKRMLPPRPTPAASSTTPTLREVRP